MNENIGSKGKGNDYRRVLSQRSKNLFDLRKEEK